MASAQIELSDTARERMRAFLDGDSSAVAVRIAVRKTGCSGYGYHVELAPEREQGDHALDFGDLPILVDAKSMPLLAGTRVDFERRGLNTTFVFHNPNATGSCGCGESFTINRE